MSTGSIVAGCLAPHPPHLVYAENPPQNEPRAECGWEELRWGYERMRKRLSDLAIDVVVVLSPHWQTYIGTHFLGVPRFDSLSVDPIFPNLFRYRYGMDVDVDLAEAICQGAKERGLVTQMMRNPDFRVDYGTIVSCHMTRPAWDLPVVGISSCRSTAWYSVEVMQQQALVLGEATRAAIQASGKRALLLASNSLSHRHFVTEAEIPEDMTREHIYNHSQYLWDMRLLEHVRAGRAQAILDEMPEFTRAAISETDAGALSWMLGAMGVPDYPGVVHAYGTVIGTGNAIVSWVPPQGGGAA